MLQWIRAYVNIRLLTKSCHWCTLKTHWISTKMLRLVFSLVTENKTVLFPLPNSHTQPIYHPHSLLMTQTTSPLTPEVTWTTGHWSVPWLPPLYGGQDQPSGLPRGQSSKCLSPEPHLTIMRLFSDWWKRVINLLPSACNGLIYCEW